MPEYVGHEDSYSRGELQYGGESWEKHDTYNTQGDAEEAGEKLENRGWVTIVSHPDHARHDEYSYYLWKRKLSR